ncbi:MULTISPECIES: M20/M25/M40 family metallo-hydrolase [unclassified Candidatus Frackibacter]|uniref:M20/M25/M40 family metallo-hydrolase n=1 Tax=unclassified Candidatus Frackibacter TaxID=2648818 RepID=UPI0008853387|nr:MULTISPECIES: M20/M25/M40 family metallo-hydrolase [unclassified Candidatus Frackibacter]SDC89046.1 peptidase T-like protein [Candidatus Frackibacter sp. WG11]SEN02861.1 peptidase T-like protein [Candidatus Frackibacter sp. WG12]SFM11489.1 peptidase T-like protein [Candidatus Frackibacter sp. WG13]
MFKEEDVINKFIELTQIDSESYNEREIADKLKKELLELGLKVNEDDAGDVIENNTGNIIAKLKGNEPSLPKLLLSAHMDTVKPGKSIEPVVEDGIIFSQGDTILGADDKAGITMILTILRELKDSQSSYGDIEVVFTVCEEAGLLGSKNLAFKNLNADYGIVCDSGESVGNIIIEGPAQTKIKAKVYGKAAHAGKEPYKGINAIKVAGVALANMELGQIDEETTANIGIVKGGEATNIVPDEVELVGEVRSRDEAKLEEQVQSIIKTLEEAAEEFDTDVEVEVKRLFPSFKLDKELSIIKLAIEAGENLGLEPKLIATGAGSDANIFNAQEIPTINFGLGTKEGHTADENIETDNFTKIVKLILDIIQNLD